MPWSALLNVYNNIIYHAPEPADVTAAYLTKGRILDEQMGRADKAAQHYERSLAYDANQPDALLRLAELALRRSDWAEAVGLAQRGTKLVGKTGPMKADLLLCIAIARHGQEDTKKAKKAVTDAKKAHGELELPDEPLADVEALREGIRARLPR